MRRLAIRAAAVVTLALSAFSVEAQPAVETPPERKQACVMLGIRPDAMLQQCGDKLRSISLGMKDISRTISFDNNSGTVLYVCPVPLMCSGEPAISGWLINPRRWTQSPRDEDTLFGLLLTPPGVVARQGRSAWPNQPHPKASCDLFDIQIAGLPGRAVCYVTEDQKATGIFAVVADDEVGFVMAFRSDELDSKGLREKVQAIVPKFLIDIATGDYGLLRWMR